MEIQKSAIKNPLIAFNWITGYFKFHFAIFTFYIEDNFPVYIAIRHRLNVTVTRNVINFPRHLNAKHFRVFP